MVSLKWGLANSNNNITAWVMKQLNPQPLVNFIHSLGIKSPMDPVPAICLGTPDFNLFELTGAYCNFANKGVHIEPIIVTRIEDRYGNVISEFRPRKKEAINEETAYMMLNMLKAVVNKGTGIRLRSKYQFTMEMGGKTGTTQNHSDGWFMGVTPNLVTGIWAGGEDRDIHFDNISLGQGANMALPSFALYMQKIYADEELGITIEDTFEKPVNFDINMDCQDIKDKPKNDELKQQNNNNDTFENEEFF
jgi:penicillin-binding protein 1A